jgi:hypothetical protein
MAAPESAAISETGHTSKVSQQTNLRIIIETLPEQ